MARMVLREMMGGGGRTEHEGDRSEHEGKSEGDKWAKRASSKALSSVRRAAKSSKLTSQGRVALLREAIALGRQSGGITWGKNEEERKQRLDLLERLTDACEAAVKADCVETLNATVRATFDKKIMFGSVLSSRYGLKVLRTISQKKFWELSIAPNLNSNDEEEENQGDGVPVPEEDEDSSD